MSPVELLSAIVVAHENLERDQIELLDRKRQVMHRPGVTKNLVDSARLAVRASRWQLTTLIMKARTIVSQERSAK